MNKKFFAGIAYILFVVLTASFLSGSSCDDVTQVIVLDPVTPDQYWVQCESRLVSWEDGTVDQGIQIYNPAPPALGGEWIYETSDDDDNNMGKEDWFPAYYKVCKSAGQTAEDACHLGCQNYFNEFEDLLFGALQDDGWVALDDYSKLNWSIVYQDLEHGVDVTTSYDFFEKCVMANPTYTTEMSDADPDRAGDGYKTPTYAVDDYCDSPGEMKANASHNAQRATASNPSAGSTLTMSIDDVGSETTTIVGAVLDFGFGEERHCNSASCPIYLGDFSGRTGNWYITVDDDTHELLDARFKLASSSLAGVYNSATNFFYFSPDTIELYYRYEYEGTLYYQRSTNSDTVTGFLNEAADVLTLHGTWPISGGDLTIDYNGSITETIPEIYSYVPSTVECSANYGAYINVIGGDPADPTSSFVHKWYAEHNGENKLLSVAESPTLKVDMNVLSHFPVEFGPTSVRHMISEEGRVDYEDMDVIVVDTTPPVIRYSDVHTTTCVPVGAWVDVAPTAVTDHCTDDSTISTPAGRVISVNGIDTDIHVVGGQAFLPIGTHIIEWTATDEFGNTAIVYQNTTVDYQSEFYCCPDDHYLLWGGGMPDVLVAPSSVSSSVPVCAFTWEQNDSVSMYNPPELPLSIDEENDFINLGTNTNKTRSNFYQLTPGEATVISESGNDVIVFHAEGDDNDFYDMDGNDVITGSNGSDYIHASFGDDDIKARGGNDFIYPGPGTDSAECGAGDDTITFFHECELELAKYKYINGGDGYDILYLPVSKDKAVNEYGLQFINIESVVENYTEMGGFSDCVIYP